ncbi:MAG: hypothetical protein ACD_10C00732G0002 [uncultured bacterium]|nr:MAG: hypothetical protein ACD_10C00732G0002 [uncultured bacterium]
MLSGPKQHGEQDAEKAAMKAHAALPDGEYLQGMGEKIGRFVEKYLA